MVAAEELLHSKYQKEYIHIKFHKKKKQKKNQTNNNKNKNSVIQNPITNEKPLVPTLR